MFAAVGLVISSLTRRTVDAIGLQCTAPLSCWSSNIPFLNLLYMLLNRMKWFKYRLLEMTDLNLRSN